MSSGASRRQWKVAGEHRAKFGTGNPFTPHVGTSSSRWGIVTWRGNIAQWGIVAWRGNIAWRISPKWRALGGFPEP